jgi:hypothetical protein
MTPSPDDPLDRALAAVDRLHVPELDPVAKVAWQEAWDALHEVLQEREVLREVVRKGRELIEVLDQYEAASENEDTARIAELAEAAEAAEDALVEALNRAPSYPEIEEQLSGEAAHLAALDRFADKDEAGEDEELRD